MKLSKLFSSKHSTLYLGILALSSCMSNVSNTPSDIDFATHPHVWSSYLLSQETSGLPADSRWWKLFHEPALEQLIEKAISENLDLAIAAERVRESRALAALNLTTFNPTLSANGSISNQRQSETSVLPVGRIPDFEADNTIYSAGFDASWEIDLFGRKSIIADIGELSVQSATETQRDFSISIIGEIARHYFSLRAAQLEASTLQTTISQQKELLALIQLKQEYGEASQIDVTRSQIILANYESALPELEGRIQTSKSSLAILTGQPPSTEFANLDSVSTLPEGPTSIPLGLTSDLLRRRPDIRLAERSYYLAAKDVDLTQLSTYPRFSLFGSAGPETTSLSDLLDTRSLATTVGALIRWNLYDGGRENRELDVSNSKLRQAELRYSQSVLTALGDVESAAANYRAASQTAQRRNEIIASHTRLSSLALDRYESGTGTAIDVLNAARDLGDATTNFVRADMQRVLALVSLYKALGGGWETLEPASPATNTASAR